MLKSVERKGEGVDVKEWWRERVEEVDGKVEKVGVEKW